MVSISVEAASEGVASSRSDKVNFHFSYLSVKISLL